MIATARAWVKAETQRMRDDRLDAINRRFMDTWERLRRSSAVELNPLELKSANSRREAKPTCSVDGHPAKARGVLSQGELHAVALSMFIPRAMQADSPFGFLMIDDPVQALDHSKVDGLAEVLSQLAAERQVVVFTHDDRLPEAAARLGLPAEVLQVHRDTGSKVSVTVCSDPVKRALDDAWSLAKDDEAPATIRIRAVAGCCRTAVEQSGLRRYRRTSSKTVAELDEELQDSVSYWDAVALGIWGRRMPSSTADSVRRRFGARAMEVLSALNNAGHDELARWRPTDLVDDTRRWIGEMFGAGR
mgnify:CR=1 FL=1